MTTASPLTAPPLFEAVPNVSAADPPTVQALARALARPGVRLIHVTSDASHGRTVMTAIGEGPRLVDGLVSLALACRERIDLRHHTGIHPRVGALDVAPLVPLVPESPAEDAQHLAHELQLRLATEAGVASVAYDAADPARRPLPDLRRGGFERLLSRVESGEVAAHVPDGASREDLRRSGFTCVGARRILVAFNVHLATDDLAAVRAWARSLRETSGGLPSVRALGLQLADGTCQIAMNILDFRRTLPSAVFATIQARANEAGMTILRSELVGCAPRSAWPVGLAAEIREPDMALDEAADMHPAHMRILETWLPGGPLSLHPGIDPTSGRLREPA